MDKALEALLIQVLQSTTELTKAATATFRNVTTVSSAVETLARRIAAVEKRTRSIENQVMRN